MKRRFVHAEATLEVASAGAAGPHRLTLGGAAALAAEPTVGGASVTRAANGDLLLAEDGIVRRVRLTGDGEVVWVDQRGRRLQLRRQEQARGQSAVAGDVLQAPMTSRVVLIAAAPGDAVQRGQVLIVVEAMKMEQPLAAPRDGVVARVSCEVGQLVDGGALLLALERQAPEESR